ncbi:MAG: hypothetical protein ACK5C3_06620 [bacterium]
MMQTNQLNTDGQVPDTVARRSGVVRGLLAAFFVMGVALIAFGALLAAIFLLVKGAWWVAATSAPYVGAIGGWVGVPLLLYGLFEAVSRMPNRGAADTSGIEAASATAPRRRTSAVCVAAATIIMVGNAALNIAASRIEAHWTTTKPLLAEMLANHDLARLVGECVGVRIQTFADTKSGKNREGLRAIADEAPSRWFLLATERNGASSAAPLPIADGDLLPLLTESTRSEPAGKDWLGLLEQWNAESNAGVDRETIEGLASHLDEGFAATFREALKEDFVRGGKAWPAIQLDIAGRLLEGSLPSKGAATPESVTVADRLEDLMDESRTINELLAEARRSDAADDLRIAERFDRVREDIQDIGDVLNKVRADILGEPVFEGFRCTIVESCVNGLGPEIPGGRIPKRAFLGQCSAISVTVQKQVFMLALLLQPDGSIVWLRPQRRESSSVRQSIHDSHLVAETFMHVGGPVAAPDSGHFQFESVGTHCFMFLAFDREQAPSLEACEALLASAVSRGNWQGSPLTESWECGSGGLQISGKIRGIVSAQESPASLVQLMNALRSAQKDGVGVRGLRDFYFCAFPVVAAGQADAVSPRENSTK